MHGTITIDTAGAAAGSGREVRRTAARAVVRRGGLLLLVRSTLGDVKLPGGGVEPGEAPAAALVRELEEECGATGVVVGEPLVDVVERRPAQEPGAVFVMTSHYVACRIAGPLSEQRLDPYEADLGFAPVWMSADDALAVHARLRAEGAVLPAWTAREDRVLALLAGGLGLP